MHRWLENLLANTASILRACILNPADVGVAAIVEQAGRIVLVQHTYTSGWLFPGGAVERGEPPAFAIIRELKEEIGLSSSAPPELMGIYVRRRLWVTNLVLLYRVREAAFSFEPGWEIRDLKLIDPAEPPPGTGRAIRRRLTEYLGKALPAPYW